MINTISHRHWLNECLVSKGRRCCRSVDCRNWNLAHAEPWLVLVFISHNNWSYSNRSTWLLEDYECSCNTDLNSATQALMGNLAVGYQARLFNLLLPAQTASSLESILCPKKGARYDNRSAYHCSLSTPCRRKPAQSICTRSHTYMIILGPKAVWLDHFEPSHGCSVWTNLHNQ